MRRFFVKRIMSVLLVLLLVFSALVPFQSTAMEHSVQSLGVKSNIATIQQAGSGYLNCFSEVEVWPGYRANLEMKLQKKTSSGTWLDVTIWQNNGSTNQIVQLNNNFQVSSSGVYRVYCIAFVYEGGSYVERKTFSSSELSY